MKKNKIFHFLLLSLAMLLSTSIAQAELKIDSVYPNVGEMGKDLTVTVRGSGFDENTRVSVALDLGNRRAIISSVDTPGTAYEVTVSGDTAYVADGSSGVQILDVSNPSVPAIIGSVDTPGSAFGITVSGDTAYVADYSGGLQIVDISNPSVPAIIGSVDSLWGANEVTVSGDTAYVTNESSLTIVDVSNPSIPTIISYDIMSGGTFGVTVSGETAYVANGYRGLLIVDVGNPSVPATIGSVDMTWSAEGVTVSGDTAYVADAKSGLQIVDISNPSVPTIIGSVDTPWRACKVTVSGDTAYVADGGSGLQIIDVGNPLVPVIIGSVDTTGYAYGVTVSGDTAYVADGESGLQIVDISNPSVSTIIGSVDTPGWAERVTLSADTAYVADESGLQIVDVSNPSVPAIIGSVKMQGWGSEVIVSGDTAYVADEDGLQIVDVSNPSVPAIIGSVDTPGTAYGVTVSSDTAYVADGGSGLQIVDISNPSVPAIIGSVDTPGYAYGATVSGDTAYVADEDGLQIIDISNPSVPAIISSVNTPGHAYGVTVSGNTAYVADGYSGLQIVDVSNPSIPAIIGSVDTPGRAEGVTVSGDTAYVADYLGLSMIDISKPSLPVIIGHIDIPGAVQDVKISGNIAFAVTGYGLAIVSIPAEITSFNIIDNTTATLTLPSPQLPGNYTLRAFNETESDEMVGAVTFAEPGTISQLQTQKALLLSGSGPYETNTLWQSTQLCTNYAYFALMTQGYPKENIQYLSAVPSDVDGDGITDVDDNATYQNFKSALLDWASDAGDLMIYITGHGGDGKFEINGLSNPPEYVTVQELDTWLDLIQQNMNGKVILIYDACMSGSFIDQLEPPAGKERIVITSSSPNENAWFLEKGALSFSYQFWASVILNANLYDSFVVAKNLMANDQTCQINANGDTTPNDKTDQALAQNIIIGRGRIAASSPPVIGDVSEDQVLQNGGTSSIIQAFNINGLNPIERVWAVIVPPSLENASSDTPITDLPTIELEDLDGDGTYEGIYKNFSENGNYNVNVYAKDSEELYAVPLQTSVTQTQFKDDSIIWNKIRDDLWIRAEINTVEKGMIQGQWQLGGQDTTARGDQVFWGYFYASPDDVTWGSSNNPDLFVKIWVDVTGPIYVDYFHVSVPDITVYTDFNATSTPAADQTHTATLTTRFVEHSLINGQNGFTLQNEDGVKPSGYSETAAPFGSMLINSLRIGTMINTVEKGPIEGVWQSGGQDTTARGDTVIWGHYYADPSLVTWGSPQNPDLFVKIWFDVGGTVNVDFFHVSVPDIEVYSELPADGAYDNSGTTVLGNRFIEHRYQWK